MVKNMYNSLLSKYNLLFDKTISYWCPFKPERNATVYTCYACRDMFRSKSSFLDHINRRVFVINYYCDQCTQSNFTFYNACIFHLHVRQHFSASSGEINLIHIKISHLPLELAGFTPHPKISLHYDVDENNEGEHTVQNTRFYSPVEETIGQEVIKLTATMIMFDDASTPTVKLVLKQISSNIPYCRFVPLATSELNVVYQRKDTNDETNIKEEYESDDSMDDSYSVFDNFGINMLKRPSCPECDVVPDCSMADHFLEGNKPTNDKFVCPLCKFIAPTNCSLQAHQRLHNFEAPFICPECGRHLDNKFSLIEHLEEVCFHLAKQVRYRCPTRNCGKIFAQLQTFMAHFTTHLLIVTVCPLCKKYFSDDLYKEHILEHGCDVELVPGIVSRACLVCKDANKEYIVEAEDDRKHCETHCSDRKHLAYIYVCKFCKGFFRSTLTYVTHLLRCSKRAERVVVRHSMLNCVRCNNRFRRPPNSVVSSCPKCGNLLSNSFNKGPQATSISTATNNTEEPVKKRVQWCKLCQQVGHNFDNCKYKNSKVLMYKLDLNAFERISSDSDNEDFETMQFYIPSSASKRQKLTSAPDIKEEFLEVILTETFKCKVCNFAESSVEKFREHIKCHRDTSSMFQCMDCGECFLVKDTLEKHLVYCHSVEDTDQYITDNSCACTENLEVILENQCKVCKMQFENSMDLNRHSRSHGMAFLFKNAT